MVKLNLQNFVYKLPHALLLGQGHTEDMTICDTSSHVNTLMNQLWYDYVI